MSDFAREIASASDFAAAFDVDDRTLARLETYRTHLVRWQAAVNLVAPRSLDHVWHRHFADSAQLASMIPASSRTLVDFGSGGGFPAMVLAILLAEKPIKFTLVESDQRKCAFLRDLARTVEIDIRVLSTRIESDATVAAVGKADVVTARALAPLERLFALASPYCDTSTVCVFPKGRDVAAEVEAARRDWCFAVNLVPSLTDEAARIALVTDLQRRQGG